MTAPLLAALFGLGAATTASAHEHGPGGNAVAGADGLVGLNVAALSNQASPGGNAGIDLL
ncbi:MULTISPECIES: hypothetical protein [Streptomyces]|uniref:hypothetical protein n=1 Tax=Streptomyces TaxID=1883 RepID=UPI001670E973|nr:hypothetical protein [Streptomyces ruber]